MTIKQNIVNTEYFLLCFQKGDISIPYKNLLAKFAHTLEAEVKVEGTNASFPVTMGVNAFRGFLDEFIKHHKKKEKKEKKADPKVQKRDRKKEKKDVFVRLQLFSSFLA